MERSGASNKPAQSHKPTFADLCFQHDVHVTSLFHATYISPAIIWAMLLEYQVERVLAVSVLGAFNTLAKTNYRLEDLDISIGGELQWRSSNEMRSR